MYSITSLWLCLSLRSQVEDWGMIDWSSGSMKTLYNISDFYPLYKFLLLLSGLMWLRAIGQVRAARWPQWWVGWAVCWPPAAMAASQLTILTGDWAPWPHWPMLTRQGSWPGWAMTKHLADKHWQRASATTPSRYGPGGETNATLRLLTLRTSTQHLHKDTELKITTKKFNNINFNFPTHQI